MEKLEKENKQLKEKIRQIEIVLNELNNKASLLNHFGDVKSMGQTVHNEGVMLLASEALRLCNEKNSNFETFEQPKQKRTSWVIDPSDVGIDIYVPKF